MSNREDNMSKKMTISEIVLAFMMSVIIVMVLLGIMSRYIFGKHLSFTEEVARLFFVWVVFIGSVEAFRRNKHIKIESFINIFPKNIKKIINKIIILIITAVLILLVFTGLKVVKSTSFADLTVLPLPASSFYLAVPFSSVLMLVCILSRLIHRFKKER